MTNEERKRSWRTAGQGLTLSQIQDYFHKEKNDPIKYMDLRLLLSEMPDAKLPEKELLKTVLPPAAPVAGAGGAFAPTAAERRLCQRNREPAASFRSVSIKFLHRARC